MDKSLVSGTSYFMTFADQLSNANPEQVAKFASTLSARVTAGRSVHPSVIIAADAAGFEMAPCFIAMADAYRDHRPLSEVFGLSWLRPYELEANLDEGIRTFAARSAVRAS